MTKELQTALMFQLASAVAYGRARAELSSVCQRHAREMARMSRMAMARHLELMTPEEPSR
jgi:hypothetical protein